MPAPRVGPTCTRAGGGNQDEEGVPQAMHVFLAAAAFVLAVITAVRHIGPHDVDVMTATLTDNVSDAQFEDVSRRVSQLVQPELECNTSTTILVL